MKQSKNSSFKTWAGNTVVKPVSVLMEELQNEIQQPRQTPFNPVVYKKTLSEKLDLYRIKKKHERELKQAGFNPKKQLNLPKYY